MTTTTATTPVTTTTTTTKFISVKNPPVLTDSVDYELWKKEIALWQLCSNCDKKMQAPAIVMSLSGSAKEAALEMEIETLNSDDGVTELLQILDGLYLKDENQRKYVSLKSLEQFKRSPSQSLDSYINEFERIHNKVKAHKILLPDSYVAYRLLESANLDQTKSELVRATLNDLSFKDMKAQLRKLEDIVLKESNEVLPVKKEEEEDVLYSNYSGKKNAFSNRGIRRNSSRGNQGNRGNRGSRGRGRGMNSRGRGSCFNCQSTAHYINECPLLKDEEFEDESTHYYNESPVEDIKLTF